MVNKFRVKGKHGGFVGILVKDPHELVELHASTFTEEGEGETVVITLTGADARDLAYKLMTFAASTSTV